MLLVYPVRRKALRQRGWVWAGGGGGGVDNNDHNNVNNNDKNDDGDFDDDIEPYFNDLITFFKFVKKNCIKHEGGFNHCPS